jgi:hypothetical protein
VGLAGLGGVLAGCSTAAVPFDASEEGAPSNGPASGGAPSSGAMSSSPAPRGGQTSRPARKKPKAKAQAKPKGTVLGATSDIPSAARSTPRPRSW